MRHHGGMTAESWHEGQEGPPHADDRHRQLPNRRSGYQQEYYKPPRRRSEDLTPLERALKSMQQLAPVFSMLTLVYLSIGFKTIKPNDRLVSVEQQLIELKARRDSDHAEFITKLNQAVDSITRIIGPTMKRTDALARYRCLHLQTETAYTLGLDCDILLPGYQRYHDPSPDDEDVPPKAGKQPTSGPRLSPSYPRLTLSPRFPPPSLLPLLPLIPIIDLRKEP
jgi:hypothetical protein